MTSKNITSSKECTFHGVEYNKTRGSLTLSEKCLAFNPEKGSNTANGAVELAWDLIVKHQVSPASHPKHLMKVIIHDATQGSNGATSSRTFSFLTRNGLDLARREVSTRLGKVRDANKSGKKRPRDEPLPPSSASDNNSLELERQSSSPPSASYVGHDHIALIATRSSLLASDPALRAQHRLLVVQNATLTEEDFWETHSRLLADEYARISGCKAQGLGSNIKSSLDLGLSKDTSSRGVIHLGVEEIRQIFLMYPAVHKAYEEKVPLELSEQEFWRKYLESEYFHRDRGRVGCHIDQMNEAEKVEMERMVGKKSSKADDKGKKSEKDESNVNMAEDDARLAAAAGTHDIFSRYDPSSSNSAAHASTKLAAGQFDLTSTAETERGNRYLKGLDLHPLANEKLDSRGSRVIDKFNRHWAVVLHPNGQGGKNYTETLVNNDHADIKEKNIDREMTDLVGFANANENDADHSRGLGKDDGDTIELTLHNVSGYSGKFSSDAKAPGTDSELALKYTQYLAASLQTTTEPLLRDPNTGKVKGFTDASKIKQAFPEPKIGRGLLEALSKKMAADSQTEADMQKLADNLPKTFKTNLATYFRRSSELLRHFFALRQVFGDDSDDNGSIGVSESQRNKLTSIVKGMEKVHGEMYELTRNLDLIESKMFKPIMDQLDWAFKLHREDSTKGGSGRGGFVSVSKGGFVPVA